MKMKQKNMKKIKEISSKEVANQIAKSMYKMVLKSIKSGKKTTDKVIDDILDPNYIAEVDPDEIPEEKTNVLYKYNCAKSEKNSLKKLKIFLDKRN